MEDFSELKLSSAYECVPDNPNLTLQEAVECAVEECIKAEILADFLIKNRAEVVSMSIFEYGKEKEENFLLYIAGFGEAGVNNKRLCSLAQLRRASPTPICQIA